MRVVPTDIPDVLAIEPKVFGDHRGWFMETWQRQTFAAHGIDRDFVQDNHSRSARLTLRGLHYQIRQPQGKLVRAVGGAVWDVAVDLRRRSPTFGRWVGCELSAENRLQLWIPPGFAHGFIALSETAEIIYKCTDLYAPQHERTLIWDDPEVGIDWRLRPGEAPILSDKDRRGLRLAEAEIYDMIVDSAP